MRALIVSADRFEDSELSEPLQQLQTKGVPRRTDHWRARTEGERRPGP